MKRIRICLVLLVASQAFSACGGTPASLADPDRLAAIPADAPKGTPEDDYWPPRVASGWREPEPLPGPINTAGGEDSPFLSSDGQSFYFFFTPDVHIPAEKSILDGVTGIWVAQRTGEGWGEPTRVWLEGRTETSLDGCKFVSGKRMYFCTARQGYTGIQWFRAEFKDGLWQDWVFAGDELKQSEYEVGELHLSADGQELYFGSTRAGGFGATDLWVSHLTANGWGQPVNLGPLVNTLNDESRPFVSADGGELWYTGTSRRGDPGPAIYRSMRQPDGTWGSPEEIVSSFAGEPNLSADGRVLYFVHHFFSSDMSQMIEADIYFTTRP